VVSGGFGNGAAGQAGSAGPELGPGESGWMFADGEVALENFGTTPAVAFVFGAIPTDSPILTVK
jgi:hypothetical protein